ncbi:MAG: 5'-methylthioadenosine/adenosylhomocysteine nucleosidase [bacterium]|jgi:adenosylhomocysteine nucleosidase
MRSIGRLGILGAMEIEVITLRHLMDQPNVFTHAGKTFYEGKVEGQPVVLSKADVGKVNAAVTAQILIDQGKVDAIVFTGVAGALDPQLAIHDLIVATAAQYHDVDVTVFGYQPGQVPRMPTLFATDPELSLELVSACATAGVKNPHQGVILSGDTFIAEPQIRMELFHRFSAVAVEMEGAAIAQTCYLNSIPFALLRAVSDCANGTAPDDFRSFSKKAAETAAEVIAILCRRMASTGQ